MGRATRWAVVAASVALAIGGCSARPIPDVQAQVKVVAAPSIRCIGITCASAHEACDPLDGRCKPDGSNTRVGERCTRSGPTTQCGNHLGVWCSNEDDDGYPGGYCSYEPCSDARPCPIGSSCAHLGGMPPACYRSCASDAGCRTPDYRCIDAETLFVAGPSHRVCFLARFPCFKDRQCPPSRPHCVDTAPDREGECGL